MDKQKVAEFRILQEIETNGHLTQRDLAKRTGISLSYLNSYLKQLMKRELILVQKMDGKRLLYNLTPQGIIEKVRMTTEYAKWSLNNYRYIREKVIQLCSKLKQEQKGKLVICGVSEAADIVYIAVLECGLEIVRVVDDKLKNHKWLRQEVCSISSLKDFSGQFDMVVISDIARSQVLAQKLFELNVPFEKMCVCTGQKLRPIMQVQLVD